MINDYSNGLMTVYLLDVRIFHFHVSFPEDNYQGVTWLGIVVMASIRSVLLWPLATEL